MAAKKISKTNEIPKYGSASRVFLLPLLTSLREYQEKINKGMSYFSESELDELKSKYKNGITWEEIEIELNKKGVEFNKSTFRKHIQEKLLPDSIGYRKVGENAVAVFPSETISHINFNRYVLKAADMKFILNMTKIIDEVQEMSIYDAINSWLGPYDTFKERFRSELVFWGPMSPFVEAIENALGLQPELRDKALAYIEELQSEMDILNKKLSDFEAFLENTRLSPALLSFKDHHDEGGKQS